MTYSASAPAQQCTPAHCTWGQVGAMYSSASFFTGLAVIIVLLLAAVAIKKGLRRG